MDQTDVPTIAPAVTVYFDERGWISTTPIEGRSTHVPPPDDRLPDGWAWNHLGVPGREWVAMEVNPAPAELPAQKPDLRISGIAFKRRLTSEERIAIRAAAAANARVYDYMDLLDSAAVVHLDDKDLVGGLRMLEAASILKSGRTDAIISAPIEQHERPA